MRIALTDDHGIFRNSLARLLTDMEIDVVISAASGDELLARLPAEPVDVALIDVLMPPTWTDEGFVTAREVKRLFPRTGVLLLSGDTTTHRAIDLLREFSGGIGYLNKAEVADIDELRGFLARVMAGDQVVGPSVVRRLLTAPAQSDALAKLSGKEREVLRLMAEGWSNVGIGLQLHLAARTVEDHIRHIFEKLNINTQVSETGGDKSKRVLAVLTYLRLTAPA
jgi:DNA-binding NarL/FixJ family response regulator